MAVTGQDWGSLANSTVMGRKPTLSSLSYEMTPALCDSPLPRRQYPTVDPRRSSIFHRRVRLRGTSQVNGAEAALAQTLHIYSCCNALKPPRSTFNMSSAVSRLSKLAAHFLPTPSSSKAAEALDDVSGYRYHVHTLSPTFFLPRAAAIEPDVCILFRVS